VRHADQFGQRQVEGREGIDLADAQMHGQRGGGHREPVVVVRRHGPALVEKSARDRVRGCGSRRMRSGHIVMFSKET
jgi:hypothetical protein